MLVMLPGREKSDTHTHARCMRAHKRTHTHTHTLSLSLSRPRETPGTLVISLNHGASLKAGVDYSLTFTLDNPAEGQASPAVTVSAANLGSFVLTSGSGNLAPLLVAGFGVCCLACAPFCPCGVDVADSFAK